MKVARITNDNKLLIKGTLTEMQKINEIELINGENLLPVADGYTLDTETGIYTVYGTKGGFRIPYQTFDGGKRYLLSFKIKKTSGDILSVAGHSASFYDFEVYLDGELIGTRWSTGLANTYPNDNLEHEYKVVLTFDSSIIDHLYIQPNRTNGYTTDFTAEVWDLKLEEINEYIDNISLDANGNLKLPNEIVELGDNYYLDLPMNNSQVTVPYNPVLHLSSAFTICLWFKLNDVSGLKQLLGQGAWGTSWTFWTNSGRPRLTLNGTHYISPNNVAVANEWGHMVISYNAGEIKYYWNGQYLSTTNGITNFTGTTRDLFFNYSQYPYNGGLKDARIFNRVLADVEVEDIYNDSNYVVGDEILWLPFNEGEGNIAYDKSGNGNNGTISNGEWGIEPVKLKLKDGVLYVSELIENAIL